jgi:cell wall-associated NlpC family hydrolase
MQPGDVINYGSHTAIYIGNNRIVHAANEDEGIIISDNPAYKPILTIRRYV